MSKYMYSESDEKKYFYTDNILCKLIGQVGIAEYEFYAINDDWYGYINFETEKIATKKDKKWKHYGRIWRGDDLVGADYNAQIEHIKKLMETD